MANTVMVVINYKYGATIMKKTQIIEALHLGFVIGFGIMTGCFLFLGSVKFTGVILEGLRNLLQ